VHELLGHFNSHLLAETTQKDFYKTKNNLHDCSKCALSKEKQKDLNKLTACLSKDFRGRINIDMSSVQNTSYCFAHFWHLIKNFFTGYLWSYFIKAKSGLPETMYDWLKLVQKEISLNAKTFRLDNSGEDKSFHQLILRSEFNIIFDFTAPGTPQQKGKLEHAFATHLVNTDPCSMQLE
jgi:hypothetical protein